MDKIEYEAGTWRFDGVEITDPDLLAGLTGADQAAGEVSVEDLIRRAHTEHDGQLVALAQAGWDWRNTPRVARRLFDELYANALSPEDVTTEWKRAYRRDGVIKNGLVMSYAMPEGVMSGVTNTFATAVKLLLWKRASPTDHPNPKKAEKARTRRDFPTAITAATYQKPPGVTYDSRSPEWLAERILSGMYPCPLLKRGAGATARIDFTGADRAANAYVLPDVCEADLDLSGAATVTEIRIRYDAGDPNDPILTVRPGPGHAWERARRTFASAMLLMGELDLHIARGHFLSELTEVALQITCSDTNPLKHLLLPRVFETSGINHLADLMVWGPMGVLCVASGLSGPGAAKVAADRFGAVDWKGFSPRIEPANQRYTAAARMYWDSVVVPYVDAALVNIPWPTLPANPSPDDHIIRAEIDAFVAEIAQRSVVWTPFDPNLTAADYVDAGELAFKVPGEKSLSPIQTHADLADFCKLQVFLATHGHGWLNIRQIDDGGEVEYACFGLRQRIDAGPAPAGNDDSAWHEAAGPCVHDALYQLIVGELLSSLRIGTVMTEDPLPAGASAAERVRVDPYAGTPNSLRSRLKAVQHLYDAIPIRFHDPRFRVDELLSRTNS